MPLRRRMSLALATVTGLLLSLSAVSTAAADPTASADAFVETDGTAFSLEGAEYHPLGSNNYYPMYSSETMVDALFADAEDAGFNTMRVWGFFAIGSPGDGPVATLADKDKGVYFQYWDDAAGAPAINEGENGLVQLDRVVASAQRHGLRLILPLTNNWSAFGGMDQYLIWAQAAGLSVDTHDDFYTDPTVKKWYRDYVDAILNRTNTITGTIYKDDPTIMTWELANEPRCVADGGPADGSWGTGLFPRDADCDARTVTPWIDEMSRYIKSIDVHHLVAVGDEGFFAHSDGDHWTRNGAEGVDTEAWTRLSGIDYMSYHLYPDHWGTDADWGAQWIVDHNASAQAIGKPALLGEFGWLDQSSRNTVYQQWLDAQRSSGGAGTLYWILSSTTDDGTLYPDYDGFTVRCPSPVCTTVQNLAALQSDPDAALDPVADDDQVTIDFGTTASLVATANDIAYQGASIDAATVDLDPQADGIQDSATVDGGTARVDAEGRVIVNPTEGFSGDLRFEYVVNDTAGRTSNTATIIVSVRPSSDAWVTFEDFSAGADRWQCTGGTTVIPTQDGAAMFANETGDWDWCFFTPNEPLDLSGAALLRYDLLGSDSGINGEVMLKVAGGTIEGKTSVTPPTWTDPAIGDDAPTVAISSYSEAVREHLDDVTQIGFGMQKGHHELANFRYSRGDSNPTEPTDPTGTEVPLNAFAADVADGWACDGGSSIAVVSGQLVMTASEWDWCHYTFPDAADLSAASALALDVIASDEGFAPEIALQTGADWTWTQTPFSPLGDAFPATGDAAPRVDLAAFGDANLADVRQINIGVQSGTHTVDNLRAISSADAGVTETVLADFEDATGGADWSCSPDRAAVATDGLVGTFTNAAGEWAWCAWTPAATLNLADAAALRFDVLSTDSGVGPQIAFTTGDGRTWSGQLAPVADGWFAAEDSERTLEFDLTSIDADYRATLGDIRQILIGVQPGTHRLSSLRAFVPEEAEAEPEPNTWTVVQDFDPGEGTWECDRPGASVSGEGGVGTFANTSREWAWCQWTPPTTIDAAQALAVRMDFLSTDTGVGPEIAFKTGDAWAWGGQVAPRGTTWFDPEDEPSTMEFALTDVDAAFRETLGTVQALLVGVQPGTHRFGPISLGTYTEQTDPESPVLVTPAAPTIADNVVTIPEVAGATYRDASAPTQRRDGQALTGSITLAEGQTLTVRAVADEGYAFTSGATTEWVFTFQKTGGSADGDPSEDDGGSRGEAGDGGADTTPAGTLSETGGELGTVSWILVFAALLLTAGLGTLSIGRLRRNRY